MCVAYCMLSVVVLAFGVCCSLFVVGCVLCIVCRMLFGVRFPFF